EAVRRLMQTDQAIANAKADPYDDRQGHARASAQDAQDRASAARRRIADMEAKRKADLSAIHAQAKRQGIDEATRRAMIERLSGGRTNTSADLTAPERTALLREIGGGRRPPPKRAGRAPAGKDIDRRAMLAKVEALLADSKLPWSYAEAILRRQRSIIDKGVACPIAQSTNAELGAVIAALSRRAKRLAGGPEGV
ncbi:MAG: DUF1018 domain-containing protein, partial [Thiobacillaceae bacterium]|nr:DUF1018 domain-containing protein [Thiobacillaceae bacterium]